MNAGSDQQTASKPDTGPVFDDVSRSFATPAAAPLDASHLASPLWSFMDVTSPVSSLTISPDGGHLAMTEAGNIKTFSTSRYGKSEDMGTPTMAASMETGTATSASFHPFVDAIAVGTSARENSGIHFINATTGDAIDCIQAEVPVTHIEWHPAGHQVLAAVSGSAMLRLYDVSSKIAYSSEEYNNTDSFFGDISQVGEISAVSSSWKRGLVAVGLTSATLHLLDLATLAPVAAVTPSQGLSGQVAGVRFTRDGGHLMTTCLAESGECVVEIWDGRMLGSPTTALTVPAGSGRVTPAVYGCDEASVFIGLGDELRHVPICRKMEGEDWMVEVGSQAAEVNLGVAVDVMAASADDGFLAIGSAAGVSVFET